MFFTYNQFSISVFVLILILCLLPGSEVPSLDMENMDKVLHSILFALLAFTMMIGLLKQYQYRTVAVNAGKITLIFGFLYGVLIEVLQDLFLPDRSFELFDIAADWGGTLIGFSGFLLMKGKSKFV